MKEVRATYNMFLENGDIYEMNEEATGEWNTDKKWFVQLYNDTIKNVKVNGEQEL